MDEKFQRHFCVTVYVKETNSDKFLFIKHKKLKKWLPPGGHVEENELPDEAAIRECYEETGLKVRLVGDHPPFDGALVSPHGIQRNIIEPGLHEHMDIIYLAETSEVDNVVLNTSETDGIKWFTSEEIASDSFDTFPSIKYWVSRFID